MKIGNLNSNPGERTYLMGILNVTPDSFSDGGKFSISDFRKKNNFSACKIKDKNYSSCKYS
jgi:dihydropteroate synthase